MAVATTTAIALALAAGATAYSVKSSNDARNDAKEAADNQAAEAQKLQTEAKNKQAQDEAVAAETEAQRVARSRLKRNSASAYGKRDTVLTSGLGGSSAPATQSKTALGS
jgi:cell division protein FtsL